MGKIFLAISYAHNFKSSYNTATLKVFGTANCGSFHCFNLYPLGLNMKRIQGKSEFS